MTDFNRLAMLAFAPGTNYVFGAADCPDSLLEKFNFSISYGFSKSPVSEFCCKAISTMLSKGNQIFMICQSYQEVVKRFRNNHKYLAPGYAVANDQDIALQQNPETLFPEVIEKLQKTLESV